MRWLDGITDSMHMSLGELWELDGQGGLACCDSWGRKESDMAEQLQFHFSFSCIGEGNGNPLQRSCLENPRDGAAGRGLGGAPGRLPSMGSHRVRQD